MSDEQTKVLAAMVYGESSTADNEDEMFGIASVLVRQRDARGYADMQTFVQSERTFSYVVGDGNPRYKKFRNTSEKALQKDPGMKTAIAAAENALKGGVDKSNGAFFWDGYDIKTNYKHHLKVRHGIKFSDPSHNVCGIEESTRLVIRYKITKIKVGQTVKQMKEEQGRYDHVYESTAGHGGTIFWKFAPDYLQVSRSKEYK